MPSRTCKICDKTFYNDNPATLDRIMKMHKTRMHFKSEEQVLDQDLVQEQIYDDNSPMEEELNLMKLALENEELRRKNKLLNEIVTRLLMEM